MEIRISPLVFYLLAAAGVIYLMRQPTAQTLTAAAPAEPAVPFSRRAERRAQARIDRANDELRASAEKRRRKATEPQSSESDDKPIEGVYHVR